MKNLLSNTDQNSHGIGLKNTQQKRLIIKALFFNGPMSNAGLSAILHLSTPKINNLLTELKNENVVELQGQGVSSGGRKPAIYGLVENGFYVAGISINVYGTIITLFNSRNKVIFGPLNLSAGMQSDPVIFSQIRDFLFRSCEEYAIDPLKLVAVGIEMPGLINSAEGINKTYFPERGNLNEMLRSLFGVPVFFENDAKVRAYNEQNFGLAKGRDNVLMLHVNWGIGLGLIINGKLFNGRSGFSGEFGHLPVSDNGLLCQCGKRGCLETLASASALIRMAVEGLREGKLSLIHELVRGNPDKIDISTLIEAARLGDQFAISLFTEAGKWLGKGIAYLIQIFNPELIIVGGSVAEAGQFMLAPIQQSVYIYSNQDISNDTEIKFTHGGLVTGTAGAAAMAIDRLTSN